MQVHVRNLESGITVTCVLQDNILFNTLPCFSLAADKIDLELTRLLLDAENGISTSSFQLYRREDETFALTLNNFCKLQEMGPDDHDDILSCLQFIEVDVYAARELLTGILD